jgi:DNA-binding NarL/FixJ family response regulator
MQTVSFDKTTPRERQVLDALVDTDGSNADIANALGISAQTVAVHVATIMLKTDTPGRLPLAVAWAMQRFGANGDG